MCKKKLSISYLTFYISVLIWKLNECRNRHCCTNDFVKNILESFLLFLFLFFIVTNICYNLGIKIEDIKQKKLKVLDYNFITEPHTTLSELLIYWSLWLWSWLSTRWVRLQMVALLKCLPMLVCWFSLHVGRHRLLFFPLATDAPLCSPWGLQIIACSSWIVPFSLFVIAQFTF